MIPHDRRPDHSFTEAAGGSRDNQHFDRPVNGDRQSVQADPPPIGTSRLSVLWRVKWIIAISAVVGGFLAAGLAALPATRYTAEATIRVSLLSIKGVPRENVLAQNDLAAQYALLATSAPVLAAAANIAKEPVFTVTATPVDGYNIVGITASATDPTRAARRATAVAEALVTYVKAGDTAAAEGAAKAVAPQLEELNRQITDTQQAIEQLRGQIRVAKPESVTPLQALLNSQLSLLGTLISNKASIFTAATRDSAAASPQLTLLDTPERGDQESNHALVYGLVAFLVVALAVGEFAVLAHRLRNLNRGSVATAQDGATSGRHGPPTLSDLTRGGVGDTDAGRLNAHRRGQP